MVLRFIKILIALVLFAGCSSSARFTADKAPDPRGKRERTVEKPSGRYQPPVSRRAEPRPKPAADSENNRDDNYNNPPVLESYSGTASYYASDFHGRTTANGEVYDMYGFTAAHPTLPFGTVIMVTNLDNGRVTKVRVNDRMPKHPGRIIDLSYGAAVDLDMIGSGLADVKLEIIEWGG